MFAFNIYVNIYVYNLYSPFLVNSRLAPVNAELRLVQTELAKLTQSEAQWRRGPCFIGKMVVPLIIGYLLGCSPLKGILWGLNS